MRNTRRSTTEKIIYIFELIRLSNHFAVHMLLIEFILFNLGDKNFEHKLSERFPEIEVEDVNKNTKLVTGIIEGKYQMLYIDKISNRSIWT